MLKAAPRPAAGRVAGIAIFLLVLPGCRHLAPDRQPEITHGSRQAVIVCGKGEIAPFPVEVALFENFSSGWKLSGAPMAGVAGRRGLAPPGAKREGDGRTPSGVFPIRRVFGYYPLQTRLPYLLLAPDLIWVDDPASPYYNRLASLRDVQPGSYELMRRKDDLYKFGAVIEYNTDPVVAGQGSAIFFHIWHGPDSATAGCVALSEENMLHMLRWLNPVAEPVAIIGLPGACALLP